MFIFPVLSCEESILQPFANAGDVSVVVLVSKHHERLYFSYTKSGCEFVLNLFP